jgi:hypothetical protein
MDIRNPAYESYKDNFVEEFVALWDNVLQTVYLKTSPTCVAEKEAVEAWLHTTMNPLEYIRFVADPHKATNWIARGQKAREKRWEKWIRTQENLESFRCMDCDLSTFNEYYMVKNDIWNAAIKDKKDLERMLCIQCLENRLGRKLSRVDFPDFPINNDPKFQRTTKLQSRLAT